MNSNFVSLSKISDQTVVEKILDEWFAKKLDLFLYFGGDGKRCRLSRCISPSLHIVGEKLISDGEEFYTSEESPGNSFLKFIPKLPLSPHLKVSEGFKLSSSIKGRYFNYEYSGLALGYWKIVPTQLSRFNYGRYVLKDKGSFNIQVAPSGSVYVHSFYSEDYLIFDEGVYVINNDLYIMANALEIIFPSINSKYSEYLPNNEVPCERKYETKKYNFALCIVMREIVVESDGIPIISKLKPEYDAMWNANISESTLCEWFAKPGAYTDIRQRLTTEKMKGIYLFLSLFCKKNNIKNTRKKASNIAVELNRLAALETFLFDVQFTEDDIKPWLQLPLS
ncbi:hypothetical protein OGV91_16820 [Citrobacter sp. Cf093]|uniref:hypothetical protein n=1 Tax=Enterobacteriaceae TaxID=543 RepID=UPI0012B74888|nr:MULTISPECIES: hypothetical protein [Enterobacteriaceae]MBY5092445.1 hypothetical protein [Citrobacter freundii]MBZ7127517.1 hypothetical protein [Klebsiella grimontii]MCK7364832.1 hypothetical protein [Enterobacter roggenkampii]MCM7873954.1 hypothetical protein [Enterobacter roggenkampii]MDM3213654.1 hypothetical protein [Citrobacter sp. Cf093]